MSVVTDAANAEADKNIADMQTINRNRNRCFCNNALKAFGGMHLTFTITPFYSEISYFILTSEIGKIYPDEGSISLF